MTAKARAGPTLRLPCAAVADGDDSGSARGDHARWMPPAAGAAPDAERTRTMPSIGGAPAGGIVAGAAADGPAAPPPDGGSVHRTALAEEPAEAKDGGGGGARPPRRKRGLLPRKRSAGGEAPEAPAAGGSGGDAAPGGKRRSRARSAPPDVPAVQEPAEPGEILDSKGRPATHAALRRERKTIIERRQSAVYHLGGLAFELYRRDLLAEPVMRDRAGQLAALDERVRQIDALLGDKERRRRSRRPPAPAGPAGCCLSCRAPFDEGDRFCSSCGSRLLPETPPASEEHTGQITPRPA